MHEDDLPENTTKRPNGRRLEADQRCMQLQAVLDYITGRLDISEQDLALLLDDHSVPGDEQQSLTSEERQRILEKQKESHREEMRGIVALCNQEMRREEGAASCSVE